MPRIVKDSELQEQDISRGEDYNMHIFPSGSEESLCGVKKEQEKKRMRTKCRACVERFRGEYDTISVGDKVKFVDVHHAMNAQLKKYKGEEGMVTTIGSGANDKYLVDFGDMRERFWISPDRLEIIEKFDQFES